MWRKDNENGRLLVSTQYFSEDLSCDSGSAIKYTSYRRKRMSVKWKDCVYCGVENKILWLKAIGRFKCVQSTEQRYAFYSRLFRKQYHFSPFSLFMLLNTTFRFVVFLFIVNISNAIIFVSESVKKYFVHVRTKFTVARSFTALRWNFRRPKENKTTYCSSDTAWLLFSINH